MHADKCTITNTHVIKSKFVSIISVFANTVYRETLMWGKFDEFDKLAKIIKLKLLQIKLQQ